MIRILLTLLFISSGVFAAASSDDSSSSMSAGEQVTKLYDKAYELVYYKKFDKSILSISVCEKVFISKFILLPILFILFHSVFHKLNRIKNWLELENAALTVKFWELTSENVKEFDL